MSYLKYHIKNVIGFFLFTLFGLFHIKKDKIVVTTMRGRKYGDNPKFIIEKLQKMRPDLDIVWLKADYCDYSLPKGIRSVNYNNPIRRIHEMSTAKVWINSHRIEAYVRKRKGQLFVETWHGGLGIKKIELDRDGKQSDYSINEIRNTSKKADVFISNSDHLTNIYRHAFMYSGPVLKCGYPKNDIFFINNTNYRIKVREYFHMAQSERICMYAPTFRDSYFSMGIMETSAYDIDFIRLKSSLERRFGEKWTILLKWHPVLAGIVRKNKMSYPGTIDATEYPDMQELLMAVDVVISDYSSCIFDAAICKIPCFTYAVDFEDYKKSRGVYYEMEELPFPFAQNNDELMDNIEKYDLEVFLKRWEDFSVKTGLKETGHASEIVSKKIINFIDGKNVDWDKI